MEQTKKCSKCGSENTADAKFCVNCGNGLVEKVTDKHNEIIENNEDFNHKDSSSKEKKKKTIMIVIIVFLLICVFALLNSNSKNNESDYVDYEDENVEVEDSGYEYDFEAIYDEYLDSSYAKVGADGSYLSIDTNPDDYSDYSNDDAVEGVVQTIYALDLPSSLIEELSSTRALDGRLSKTYGNITVSWSYHPDNGLEILFTQE